MAKPKEREIIDYTGPVSGDINLSDFFTGYLDSMQQAKASAASQINTAYDSLIDGVRAQKEQIVKQADRGFRDIYANARVSANNQNEQLAAMGLSRGNAQSNSSGYGETSRVRQDIAMQNNLSSAAFVRDGNLAAADSQMNQINAQRAQRLSELEQQYGAQYLSAMQQVQQMQFNYYTWKQEFDREAEAAALAQQNREAEWAYRAAQDALAQQNWQAGQDYRAAQDALAQQNWQAQFDYNVQQDMQAQKNWMAEYLLKQQAGNRSGVSAASAKPAASGAKEDKSGAKPDKNVGKADPAEQKFEQYLRFAQSSASFPTAEAYAGFFDQLYRQKDITLAQYRRALRQKGYADNIIDLRLSLM